MLFLLAVERLVEEGCLDGRLVPVLHGQDLVGIREKDIQTFGTSARSPQAGQLHKLAPHLNDIPGIQFDRHEQAVVAPWKCPPGPLQVLQGWKKTKTTAQQTLDVN